MSNPFNWFLRRCSSVVRTQSGDTIVEVLVAVAVASLVLVAAYVTTNSNILSTEDSQEHGQALQLVQAQVELMHSQGAAAGTYCYYTDPATGTISTFADTSPECKVNAAGIKTTQEPVYNLKIAPAGSGYGISATWNNLRGGKDNVTIYYRPN